MKYHLVGAIVAIAIALAMAWCSVSRQFDRADALLHDVGHRLRPVARFPHPQVGLLFIDEEDVARYGPWPFSRAIYARLLERLVAAGCAGVGFDVLFFDPSAERPQGDRTLIEAVKKHLHQVVIPFEIEKRLELRGTASVVERTVIKGPFPALAEKLVLTGFVNVPLETLNTDGVLRRTYLRRTFNGRVYDSFALAVAEVAGASPEDFVADTASAIWYRQGQAFTQLHLRDVLDGTGARSLRGKVVLVGASAPALMDVKVTPIGPIPGVELNANLVASVLDSSWVRQLPAYKTVLIILALATFTALGGAFLTPVAAVGLTTVAVIVWCMVTVALMATLGLALPSVGPMVACFGATMAQVLAKEAIVHARERQRLASLPSGSVHLETALELYRERQYEEALIAVQQAEQAEKALSDDECVRARALRCQILARLGESRLLDMSLKEIGGLPHALLYETAVVFDDEGYLSHARRLLDMIYRADIGYADVDKRLQSIRERARRGELIVNVKGVRELLGSRFSRVKPHAEGAMGVVFTAHDARLDKRVAIKVLHPYLMKDERALRRFLAEVRAVRALKHVNIVRVFDIEKGKAPYYTMEYCDGSSLATMIEEKKLDERRSLAVALGIARGLAHAHERKVIHRDLKPDNIIVTKEGIVKIIDFGVAKTEFSKGMTVAGEIIGTRQYMAPEQAQGGEVGQAADIYSLGKIMKEMGLGHLALVEQMLAPDPADRPTSVADSISALAGFEE